MNVLDLSTQTDMQLELLVAREEKTINAINNILTKIDEVCMEEMGMTIEQLLEVNDYAIDRLNTLKSEIKDRASTLQSDNLSRTLNLRDRVVTVTFSQHKVVSNSGWFPEDLVIDSWEFESPQIQPSA